jgi:peptidoglycan/xylan/chitin deacetylase (PgdA/CDA1 family)
MRRPPLVAISTLFAATLLLSGCGSGTQRVTATWHVAPALVAGVDADAGNNLQVTPAINVAPSPSANGRWDDALLKFSGTDAVALTFDDGPDPQYTPRLLAALRQHQVKATFCVIGESAAAFPDLIRQIAADGHMLCNHTWNHDMSLGRKSEDVIRADLQRTNDAIHAGAPNAPIRYFRHPGGSWTQAAVAVAGSLGMKSAHWQVDPTDWNVARFGGGAAMTQHILTILRTDVQPGDIVLMHDGGGERSGTMGAVEALLPEWRARQYQFIALP